MRRRVKFFTIGFWQVFFLTLFHAVNNYIWLRLNRCFPVDDEAFHLVSSFRYLDALQHFNSNILLRLTQIDNFYPPLFALLSSWVGLFFGKNARILIMANVLFMFVIFICMYQIGKKIGQVKAGIIASCFLSLYPIFFHLSRMFMIETLLCCMIVLSILIMLLNEDFQNLTMCLWLGIVFGLGMLTKQYYFVFILGPLVYLFTVNFVTLDKYRKIRMILNITFSFLIGFIVASLWYAPNWRTMFLHLERAAFDQSLVPHNISILSLRSLFFYLDRLINEQLSFPFFIVFLIALFCGFKNRKYKYFYFFISWIAVPYIFFTFFANKFLYYTTAYLPAVALISAWGILNLANRVFSRRAILFTLLIGFFQFFLISYVNLDSLHKKTERSHFGTVYLKLKVIPWYMEDILATKRYPRGGDWQVDTIVAKMVSKNPAGRKLFVGVLSTDANLLAQKKVPRKNNYVAANFDCLRYYLVWKDIPHKIIHLANLKDDRSTDKLNFIISTDIIDNVNTYTIKKEDYGLLEKFIMPDESAVYLYALKIGA